MLRVVLFIILIKVEEIDSTPALVMSPHHHLNEYGRNIDTS